MNACPNKPNLGTYGYDVAFLKNNHISCIELSNNDGKSKVLISPGYQGRVMTTTAEGDEGKSFGWLNYKLISSGIVNPQFNPIGGEERFWLGPEGGPFSLYFQKGKEQIYSNWKVPSTIDTEPFNIVKKDLQSVSFSKDVKLINASGNEFSIRIDRKISILDNNEISQIFGIKLSNKMSAVAYKTDNTIHNIGRELWTKDKGLISIWLLCMFNPTPTTTVFIPYNKETEGKIVNDEYFGKIPEDRLKYSDGIVFFKIDGKYRSKIGLPGNRAKGICGSYDSKDKILTILTCTPSDCEKDYVNSIWGSQNKNELYSGDSINAYNDGPVEDGTIMGPFYEIETSSFVKPMAQGDSLNHVQNIIHIQAEEEVLEPILENLFGLNFKSLFEAL
jgi:hypothetical protein